MSNPLRLGVAGLGVVGTSLVRLLQRRRAELAKRVGRDFARNRLQRAAQGRPRGRSRRRCLLRQRRGACGLRGHRHFRRIDRRRRGRRVRRRQGRAFARDVPSSRRTRRCSRRTVSSSRPWLSDRARSCSSKRRLAAAYPIIKTLRESLAGNAIRAGLRHPQRHLQLHPLAHGDRESSVRGLSQRGSEAWLCGGRSDIRRRRL